MKADGSMLLYSNNFARDNRKPYSGVRTIGGGWNNFATIF
ncbi:hypothetical protein Aau02nite_49890 [Amorphoplanes auranticolor]|uniref:Uncharacterized protein n=1 Tax=Actinoplanes auranticolor TaxID=47988 RepID=A0A919SHS2_9ACTN|nr:hypothetical protein Aau02nite_49890 [Actinoplanes auranticolor]